MIVNNQRQLVAHQFLRFYHSALSICYPAERGDRIYFIFYISKFLLLPPAITGCKNKFANVNANLIFVYPPQIYFASNIKLSGITMFFQHLKYNETYKQYFYLFSAENSVIIIVKLY